ncbi:YqzG/YhdC family protein [Ferdinandcohnia sp. Marseille-Q9671]
MLQKLLLGCCLTFFLTQTIMFTTDSPVAVAETQKQAPEYAKWGRLAMKETQKRYPEAQIIDYLHVGKQQKNRMTVERFKLWMKQGNREFGAFVNITFETETERVRNITVVETDR